MTGFQLTILLSCHNGAYRNRETTCSSEAEVVLCAGPLIRILGDRFPWEIKAAILATLGLLIRKAGLGLKPFVPQLQTTFLKCLADQVRASTHCTELASGLQSLCCWQLLVAPEIFPPSRAVIYGRPACACCFSPTPCQRSAEAAELS